MHPLTGETYEQAYDLDPWFTTDKDGRIVFTGETLDVIVLRRMEAYNFFSVTDVTETIGVAELIIDEKYVSHLQFLAKIRIGSTDVQFKVHDGVEYAIIHLTHGDAFMLNDTVLQQESILYGTYVETITRGNYPYWFTYEEKAKFFDLAQISTGTKIPVDHSIFEAIYSYLTRLKDNRNIQYRNTDMTKPEVTIPLRDVGYATNSTTARLQGSYYSQGLNASLLHESEERQPFEDIMRCIPTAEEPDDIT